ncbi:MAG TPA: hypothetical protein VHT96_10130 [Clostridia bacterium]|nr:hypothetical protein [Clostridia bacterium]
MTKINIIKYNSNAFMFIGGALGIYALWNIYVQRGRLPAGVCPVNNNRPELYAAIVLCVASFILSFFEGKKDDKGSK